MAENTPSSINRTVGQLQAALLTSVLQEQSISGGERPIRFPDIAHILHQSPPILLDENLAGDGFNDTISTPLQLLTAQEIKQIAHTEGDVAYLRFQPPQIQQGLVRLVLEARFQPGDPNQQELGLGGLRVEFHESGGQWQLSGDPVLYAS